MMLVRCVVTFLLVCATVMAATEANATATNADEESDDDGRPDFEQLITQLGQAVSRMGDKLDKQLKSIERKLVQLNNRVGAVDSELKQIQVNGRKGSTGENVTPLNDNVAPSKTAPLLSIPPQLAQNDLQKLSSQIATLATSSEKRIAQLECKIHEQLKTITDRAKRALLDAQLAPVHECHFQWTVFQRRSDGSVNFYRNWMEYQHGFGDRDGEFWLGLDQLSALLSTGRHELRVQLEAFNGQVAYALYDDFQVGNATEKYQLKSVGKYSGTAGDSLTYHEGQPFSTVDVDNDASSSNCANVYDGAWWYGMCAKSNLNGKYGQGDSYNLMNWVAFQNTKGLKSSTMMVRPYPAPENSEQRQK